MTIRTIKLPSDIEPGCAAGDDPADYDPELITEQDVARDHALRRLRVSETESIPRLQAEGGEQS